VKEEKHGEQALPGIGYMTASSTAQVANRKQTFAHEA